MAKDFSYRGGKRVRTGAKSTPANEKINQGKKVRIMNNDLPDLDIEELEAVDLPAGAVLEGADMPKPSSYLSARQKDGRSLGADKIYKEMYQWLKKRRCENLVNPRLIETYATSFARYVQCEEAISQYGLLGKHPTTGGVIPSPYVAMAQSYHKQANLVFCEIEDIVKENCTEPYSDTPSDDLMEQILKARV